jgi:hypothetical protein
MDKETLHTKYGPPTTADNSFAAKARFLQSWYRVNVLNQTDYGFGPDKNSKTKYGNILVGGEETGSNFLLPSIFKHAQYRTQFLKNGETISEYRLFNNMLSSQPMCFNLFYPLKALFEKDHIVAAKIFSACFPSLKIAEIVAVEIEYLPYPKSEYLNDLTAFDAMLIYTTLKGERNILAIETKYVEKLGSNPSNDKTKKKQEELVDESLLFIETAKNQASKGFGQLGRNILLAEKFRIVNRLDKAFAVVISPSGNDSSQKEINDFHSLMHPDYHDRLFYLSLEEMVDQIKDNVPKALLPWILDFNRRYLVFSECEAEFTEYKRAW